MFIKVLIIIAIILLTVWGHMIWDEEDQKEFNQKSKLMKYDNSHLCGDCNGTGLDGGFEMCKACKATGIDKTVAPKIYEDKIKKFNEPN